MDNQRAKREEMTTELLAILDRIELIVKQMVTAGSQAFLYSGEHPAVKEYIERAHATMGEILEKKESFAISSREGMLVYENIPLYRLSVSARKFIDYLEAKKVNGMIVTRGLSIEELMKFVEVLVSPAVKVEGREAFNRELAGRGVKHITVMEIKKEDDKEWSAREPQALYEDAVRLMRAFTHAAIQGKTVDLPHVDGLVSEIAAILSRDWQAMLALSSLQEFDEHAFTHAANVCVLATSFAALFCGPRAPLAQVCHAALLHDVGKLSLPPEILFKAGSYEGEELAMIRRHPMEGARMIEEYENPKPLAIAVAYEHHMQFDLRGYPKAEGGGRPHPVSLLVQVADAYDNLTRPRPGLAPLGRARALCEIASRAGTVFDPSIVKGFLAMMGYFVPGALVELEGGATGIVEEMNTEDPGRPVVRLVRGGASGSRVDLGEKGADGAYARPAARPSGGAGAQIPPAGKSQKQAPQ